MSFSATNPAALSNLSPSEKKTFPTHVWEWLMCFRSVQLAIILLSLLATGTLIGVLMPQEGLVEIAKIKHDYGENYKLLKALGLFNVYSSYWFITLEVLFFFNLLCGSFQWLKPAFNSAVQRTFCGPEHILASANRFELLAETTQPDVAEKLIGMLKSHHYGVYQEASAEGTQLYATKGNFSRLGPCVAHLGILILLVASVYGAFTGFKAQKLAVPGETFNFLQSQVFNTNVHPSLWQGSVPNWLVKVEDFRIEFYKDHPETPKQFFCNLKISRVDGTVLKRQQISVNHPVNIGDVTIYQASFSPTGKLFMEVNGQRRVLEVNTQFQNRSISVTPLKGDLALVAFPFFVQQDPGVTRNNLMLFLRKGEHFVGTAPGHMPHNLRLYEGQSGTLDGLKLKFIKPEIATGLQIKSAPEVPWMYLAYLIIISGTVMCIFSQRQLWMAVRPHPSGKGQQILCAFRTNKARVSFMKEIGKLQEELFRQGMVPPPASQERVQTV